MEAILFVCHGSRVKKANEQAASFVQSIMKKINVPIQEIAFLELASPTIAEAFKECVYKGAKRIIVIPVLLLTAKHVKEDIPREINQLMSLFPGISTIIGKPIGVHEGIIDILVERMDKTGIPSEKNASVLLVGRGSSDPEVKSDLLQIGELLKNRIKKNIGVCFLAAANPTFQEGLNWAKNDQTKQIFIIPYLLFQGVLIKQMEQAIEEIRLDNESNWILCPPIGYHPNLGKIIVEQIQELRKPF